TGPDPRPLGRADAPASGASRPFRNRDGVVVAGGSPVPVRPFIARLPRTGARAELPRAREPSGRPRPAGARGGPEDPLRRGRGRGGCRRLLVRGDLSPRGSPRRPRALGRP